MEILNNYNAESENYYPGKLLAEFKGKELEGLRI